MTNLIGAEIDEVADWLAVPGASVHLYGKPGPARPQNGPCDAGFHQIGRFSAFWGSLATTPA